MAFKAVKVSTSNREYTTNTPSAFPPLIHYGLTVESPGAVALHVKCHVRVHTFPWVTDVGSGSSCRDDGEGSGTCQAGLFSPSGLKTIDGG